MSMNEYFHFAGLWLAVASVNLKAGDRKWFLIYSAWAFVLFLFGIFKSQP